MRILQDPSETYITVNFVPQLWTFLRRWDDRTDQHSKRIQVGATLPGRIVTPDGRAGLGYLLTYWHPNFMDVVEPGVRRLTELLITRLDCVTYSSCEGHASEQIETTYLRYVSVVCRNDSERRRFLDVLEAVATDCAGMSDSSVRVVIETGFIDTDDGNRADTVDVVFSTDPSALGTYFDEVDDAYGRFCRRLERVHNPVN